MKENPASLDALVDIIEKYDMDSEDLECIWLILLNLNSISGYLYNHNVKFLNNLVLAVKHLENNNIPLPISVRECLEIDLPEFSNECVSNIGHSINNISKFNLQLEQSIHFLEDGRLH
jgi:hypothetical protein